MWISRAPPAVRGCNMRAVQLGSLRGTGPGGSACRIAEVLCAWLLASCCGDGGGGVPAKSYMIGTRVTGLANVTGLQLQDNGTDTLTIAASGSYSFATQIVSGGTYSVTILGQPAILLTSPFPSR